MKTMLTYLIAGLFLFSVAGNVAAIEKKEKQPQKVTQKKSDQDKKKEEAKKKSEQVLPDVEDYVGNR